MRPTFQKITFSLIFLLSAIIEVASKKCFQVHNPSIVKTKAGLLEGKIVDNLGIKYHSFKGIPYAEPPVGNLRFQAPVPFKKWKGVRKAFEHGSYCANRWGVFDIPFFSGGSEDCLFLNVYTPSLSGKKSVMFWIHGGSFMSGNGDSSFYGPEHLIKEGVVLVTINYRLSAFGFLSTGDDNAPGNQGLKDIVLALKWVEQNIEKFGGDPNQVTIFGHSAGSSAVHYLLISHLAEGLYHKAIMQSGSSLMEFLLQQDPQPQAEALGHRLNLTFSNNKELIEELTKVDFQKIVDVESPLFAMGMPWALKPLEFVPSIEPKATNNPFLKEAPIDRMLQGNFAKVPLMLGSTNFEGMFLAQYFNNVPGLLQYFNSNPNFIVPLSLELGENSKEITGVVKDLQNLFFEGRTEGTLVEWLHVYSDEIFRICFDRVARFYANTTYSSVYYYEFAYDGSIGLIKNILSLENFEGVCHGDELVYLFEPHMGGFYPDDKAKVIRNQMTKMWTNFAKYGNPTPETTPLIPEVWKPYTADERSYFVIDEVLENRSHPPRMDAISDLYVRFTGHF